MIALALASVRHRPAALAATFVNILLGTALIGSFATLVETATGPVSRTDQETLVTLAAVVGGWGALIVLFAVASTVGVTVTQRDVEIGLLRTVGASPRQARRLVQAETLLVAALAAAAGAALATVGGRVLLALLRHGDLVSGSVGYGATLASPTTVAAGVVVLSLLAAGLATRRATRGPASIAPSEGRTVAPRRPWWRLLAAVVLIGYGVAMGVVTVTVTAHDEDPYAAMQTSGSCSILVGIGLALLSPWLLRYLSALVRPGLARSGAAGYLAAYNTSRRAPMLAGILAPVTVLTAAATGTLMVVGIDGRTLPASGFDTETAEQVTLLNNVVVAMIALFAAVVVVNSFAAVIAHRRSELHRLWLLGATPRQVHRSVLAESAVVALIGAVLGTVAALASIVPFGIARHEGIVPDGQLWLPPVVALAVMALSLAAARSAVKRTAPISTETRSGSASMSSSGPGARTHAVSVR